MMFYAIYDTRTANMVGTFSTEDEALAAVREAVALHGKIYVRA